MVQNTSDGIVLPITLGKVGQGCSFCGSHSLQGPLLFVMKWNVEAIRASQHRQVFW